ncbi:MAG: glycosyltransferase [Chitinophagaceae bacterium]
MKIAAVVILYHPSIDLISNIQSYYNYVDVLFVFDNSETKSFEQDRFSTLSKIQYYKDFQNQGIASRLNTACELSIKGDYQWLLTMDQDTSFSEEAIKNYLQCFENFQGKDKVAGFGTNFKKEKVTSIATSQSKNVHRLITSGMLLNLSLYEKIGGFDEALFIDLVDNEYCIAAKKLGYSLIEFSDIYITHNLGKQVHRSSIKSLFLIKKKKNIHTPLRCYYMYRNMLYIKEKYKGSNIWLAENIKGSVISHIMVCILYGRQTLGIFKSLFIADKDFRNKKMGKIEKEF